MIKQRLGTTISLVLSLWTAHLSAEVQIPPDWHQVEVIVFAQQDPAGEEGHPLNPVLAYPERMQLLRGEDQLNSPLRPGASYNETLAALMVPERFLKRETAQRPLSYMPLDKPQRQLDADAYALSKRSGYRVLYHGAWLQPVESEQSARAVYLSGGNAFDKYRELEGSITIAKSRFYHVSTNLWLTQFAPAAAVAAPAPSELPADPTAGIAPPVTAEQQPVIALPEPPTAPVSRELERLNMMDDLNQSMGGLPINQTPAAPAANQFAARKVDILKANQQIGLNSITYLDHPRLGVLVLVSTLGNDKKEETEAPLE